MKVLLTGYSGFLGRHLAYILKEEGFSLRVLLHRHTVARRNFDKQTEVIWGSIDKPEIIKQAVKGVQIVVHSAYTPSSPSSQRPTINEKGAEILLKESIRASVEFFAFISSVVVYGMNAKGNSIMEESSPLAMGNELLYIYPSEKIKIEHILQSFNRKNTKLGIFRPGPIFDNNKGPIIKILRIANRSFGMGIGNGRNHMPYIHAKDVADAVVKWLKNGHDDVIFNVTPTSCLRYMDWYRNWSKVHGQSVKPFFIRSNWVRLAAFGINILKKILGKQSKGDLKFAILSSTRNIRYSNEALKKALEWTDRETAKYTDNV